MIMKLGPRICKIGIFMNMNICMFTVYRYAW